MIMAIDTKVPVRVRRANSLGQLDSEFDYGPQPLAKRDVPIDLRERYIRHDKAGAVPELPGGGQDLSQLINDVHSIAGTLVLRRGLLGRIVTVTSTPQLVINQQEIGGRGYLLLNPAGVVGLTAKGTLVASQVLAGATTLQSASLGVANYKTAKLFINATFTIGAGPVTFDIETLDPITGTVQFISQTLSMAATGQLYADLGTLGVDTDLSVLITVPGGTTITVAIGFVLKDGLEGTSAGVTQTIFLGGPGVRDTAGYPLLSGKERPFYLMENVQLYAVTAGPNLDMNIFEL
jgi:hypothetical protein